MGPQLVVFAVIKPHSEWAQPGIGTPLVLPEVRKPHSEWAQPGIGAAGVGVCVCVFGCVWLVVPGVRKPHLEWAQPGIGLGVGAKFGSA